MSKNILFLRLLEGIRYQYFSNNFGPYVALMQGNFKY